MSILSPAAQYHAEVREELDSVARIFAFHKFVAWSSRGLLAGLVVSLVWLTWLWAREAVASTAPWAYLLPPLIMGILAGVVSTRFGERPETIARRLDRAAGLQERTVTALHLGSQGADHPLAIAQLKDAAEHVKHLDAMQTFPLHAPKYELIGTLVLGAACLMVAFAPNPFSIQARANNPAITAAREQAQKVDRLAESIAANQSPQVDQLREMLKRGAQTIEARSADPEAALTSLEDLEEQLRLMSAPDDELAAALAAIAGGLAAESTTSNLASAISTGDLREVSRAAQQLASGLDALQGEDRARLAKALQDAANQAGRTSPEVAGALGDAASALQQSAGQGSQQRAQGGQPQAGASEAEGNRAAAEALAELGANANAAAERQGAQSQLEASRNAMERALGRGQSRAGNSSNSSAASRRQQQQGAAGQSGEGAGSEAGGEGAGQGDGLGQGDAQDSGGGNGSGGDGQGQSGAGSGSGSGTGTGGGNVDDQSAMLLRSEQLSSGGFVPGETSSNPFLGDVDPGSMNAGEENVNPNLTQRSTQGGDSGAIPLGLRDLVKDYFTSLDRE